MAPGDDELKDNLNNPEQQKVPSGAEFPSMDDVVSNDSDVVANVGAESQAVFEEEKLVESTVTAQPVQFASFEDLDQVQGPQNQNLNILLDVKLQLTVELGRTELPIKKVLELTKGSIVTLNKAAGEPVELFANGKLIAYGEVVVIEDNFGLRITHITDPAKRLNSLGAQTAQHQELQS